MGDRDSINAVCVGGPLDGQIHQGSGHFMTYQEHPPLEPLAIAHSVDHYEPPTKHHYYAMCWRADKSSFDRFVWIYGAMTRDEAMLRLINFYGNR